jgi:hypothetical protein
MAAGEPGDACDVDDRAAPLGCMARASFAFTWIWVSRFSQMRGAARNALGPISRRSRCTVSGPSGQLQAKPIIICRTSV